MKHLISLVMLFAVTLCISCGGNSAVSSTAGNTSASSNVVASFSSGDAHFSYNLDGTKISGGSSEDMPASFNNQAHVSQNDYGKSVAFFLNDASADNDGVMYPHSIRFVVKATTGMQQVTADEDHWSVQLFISSGDSYIVYSGEAFTISVTNISASRVSGTFSGKFKIATPGAGKEELTVTDGKFDIPIGTAHP